MSTGLEMLKAASERVIKEMAIMAILGGVPFL